MDKYCINMKHIRSREIVLCPTCENIMSNLQSCHLRCNNCGAELTCSDKGFIW